MTGIQGDNLSIIKEKTTVLSSLTFAVPAGSITGLLGPSGSGKTTLMRAIVGVQKISNGTLIVLDEPAGTVSLRRKIGYVTQAPAIYKDLTVKQNIAYFASLVSAPKEAIENSIDQVQLREQESRLAQTLSGGQQARVSLAIALLGSPELLVLDEPTVGLDPLLRRDLWLLFRKLADDGKTLLISSHVMDEADRCDNLLLLRNGGLLWQGSRSTLLEQTHKETTEAAFIHLVEERAK